MYPKHRKSILNQITERLKSGKRCVLISTSLVEAGIDLDFQTVYRQRLDWIQSLKLPEDVTERANIVANER